MTNFLAGIRTNDFVILASDKNSFAQGAITISDDHNKEVKIGENLYISVCGESADANDFGSWARANLRLYETRHGYELSPSSTHHWLRQNISDNLRSENFWQVNLLIGGYDKILNKAYLGSVDYLGNSIPDQNYLFSGFPGLFCYSIVDSVYRTDITEEEAIDIIKKCLIEIKKRVIINFSKYSILIINKNGSRKLEDVIF